MSDNTNNRVDVNESLRISASGSKSSLIVLKFGGSVLRSEDDLKTATHEVYSWVRRGWKVVAVVSAFHGETDRLVAQTKAYGEAPDEIASAALIATGELASGALLSLALDRAGIASVNSAPWTIGLRAEGSPLDAALVGLDRERIDRLFDDHDVVVVPGFVGVDGAGNVVLLGRGGSDLTALFLGVQLRADRCRLVKDVDGLYEYDPELGEQEGHRRPRRYRRVSWAHALRLDGGIVQHKAIRFAVEKRLVFEVGTFLQEDVSEVGDYAVEFAPLDRWGRRPTKVALLGCGTVGFGVHQSLARLPASFRVVGVAARRSERAVETGIPRELVRSDAREVAACGADVVVEMMGGVEEAAEAIEIALANGASVVTSNKAVLSQRWRSGVWADAIAEGRLRYSAAVGGAAPLLEAVARCAARERVVSIEGVFNGTTNTVLDLVSDGMGFEEAIREAQRLGFAEADPSRDLDGRDVADKLAILARHALECEIESVDVGRIALNAESIAALHAKKEKPHDVVRFVGRIDLRDRRAEASVEPVALARDHELADVRRERNAVVVTTVGEDGRERRWTVARGKGAGRWPTTEAVVADLWDLRGGLAEIETEGACLGAVSG